MLALIVIQTAVVVLLAILVAGLLRSHADILRALHDLGVGLGDPSTSTGDGEPPRLQLDPPQRLPGAPAADLAGTTPSDDAVAYTLRGDHDTLLAFLSSGCTTCRSIWAALEDAGERTPAGVRVLVVTGDARDESASRLAELAERVEVPVVRSSEAWDEYQVPVSPYFVLVDGATGSVAGEGAAGRWDRVVELVERARADEAGVQRTRGELLDDRVRRRRVRAMASDRDRERRIDDALTAAGIHPGDPRLHFAGDRAGEDGEPGR